MNILIIDDEPYLLEKLGSVLTGEFYSVATAGDGREGLDKIWNDTYDLILLDIMLPGMSGFEILAEIPGRRDPDPRPDADRQGRHRR